MTVYELSSEQMLELKQQYLEMLADEGNYASVLNVDYDEPSQHDLSFADEIVPDDIIFTHYEGIDFVPDDFFCTACA